VEIGSAAKRSGESAYFIICNECFWCASLLVFEPVSACPSCSKSMIEVMPLASNERYAFDYSASTGVMLEFSPKVNGKASSAQTA
jgi:hypothetical protein